MVCRLQEVSAPPIHLVSRGGQTATTVCPLQELDPPKAHGRRGQGQAAITVCRLQGHRQGAQLGSAKIRRAGRSGFLLLAGVLATLLATLAAAHEVRPAYLQIVETEPERFQVLWKQPIVQDRRLPIEPILPQDCPPLAEPRPQIAGGALLTQWQVACPLDAGLIHIRGLARTLTDVMVELRRLDKAPVNVLLRPSAPSFDLSDPTPRVAAYLRLGIEHLLFGIDHVLFVIGLVYCIPNRWALLKTITSFTLAHSITLALSVLELVRLPQGPVEAVIALSILFLARELMLPPERRSALTRGHPWIMAFTFGLLHGFGFAGALAEIGLPREQLALALLLFNVGIEAGQVLIIVAMLALLWAMRRLSATLGPFPLRLRWALPQGIATAAEGAEPTVLDAALIHAMGALAAYWTIDRVLGML